MISCKECATLNSLDSAFCKKCGKAMPQEEAVEAREKLEQQVDRGFELFHHGRTDEAALIAETALAADPSNLRPLSLRAMIFERKGMVPEAIDAYEQIVARDPNAALERMKLQTLRATLDAEGFGARQPNRKMALVVAGCAAVMVISLGALAALMNGSKQQAAVAYNDGSKASFVADTFSAPPAASPKASSPDTDNTNQGAAKSSSDQGKEQATSTPTLSPGLSGTLPKPVEGGEQSAPVNPLQGAEIQQLPPAQTSTQAPSNTATAPTNAEPQSAQDPDPSAVQNAQPDKQADPPPIVDIRLSQGAAGYGSDQRIDANGIEALERSAKSQFMVGNYQAAAGTYLKALNAGADPGVINQRLAQCYEKLGRNSDAIDAYGKSINGLENEINRGKGNKDYLLAVLETSKQALKNLQGG